MIVRRLGAEVLHEGEHEDVVLLLDVGAGKRMGADGLQHLGDAFHVAVLHVV